MEATAAAKMNELTADFINATQQSINVLSATFQASLDNLADGSQSLVKEAFYRVEGNDAHIDFLEDQIQKLLVEKNLKNAECAAMLREKEALVDEVHALRLITTRAIKNPDCMTHHNHFVTIF